MSVLSAGEEPERIRGRIDGAERSRQAGANRRNLALIGMPGSGKSTVARAVAARLGREWCDTDAMAEQSCGMSVSEIFKEFGEEYFRHLETDIIQGLASKSGAVISTGGGAVERNADSLARSATVVYLRRPLEAIAGSVERSARPLLRGSGDLERLYERRRAMYEAACDYIVDNSGAFDDAVERVLEVLREIDSDKRAQSQSAR
jgi:shikimate kinase